MRKSVLLLLALFLISCGNGSYDSGLSSFNNDNSSSSGLISSSEISSELTSFSSSFESSSSYLESSSVSSEDSKIPANKDNKIILSTTKTSFSFYNEMPDYFRAIYGNNFVKGDYYSDGTLKISCDYNDKAKQGFQTAMFVGDKKLEVRLQIGEMYAKEKSHYKKGEPIVIIYSYDESGKLLKTDNIDEIKKTSENNFVRTYIKGAGDVAYLEFIVNQAPYSNGKSYNFGLKGIDLIAWPNDN